MKKVAKSAPAIPPSATTPVAPKVPPAPKAPAQNGTMTRAEFLVQPPLTLKMPDGIITCVAREFSSGSFGYGFSGKINVAGQKCQASINIVVAHSKDIQ